MNMSKSNQLMQEGLHTLKYTLISRHTLQPIMYDVISGYPPPPHSEIASSRPRLPMFLKPSALLPRDPFPYVPHFRFVTWKRYNYYVLPTV